MSVDAALCVCVYVFSQHGRSLNEATAKRRPTGPSWTSHRSSWQVVRGSRATTCPTPRSHKLAACRFQVPTWESDVWIIVAVTPGCWMKHTHTRAMFHSSSFKLFYGHLNLVIGWWHIHAELGRIMSLSSIHCFCRLGVLILTSDICISMAVLCLFFDSLKFEDMCGYVCWSWCVFVCSFHHLWFIAFNPASPDVLLQICHVWILARSQSIAMWQASYGWGGHFLSIWDCKCFLQVQSCY